jgi:hypothetical protein
MANSDKNILITPNISSTTADPKIVFSGADASTGPQNITLQVYPTNSGTLSFEGSAGQLLSISNTMTGTIFAANDVSGVPSIEVLDTGLVKLAQYGGNVLIGSGVDNATDRLQVTGSINATSTIKGTTLTSTVATGTSPLVVTSSTMVANLNANYWNGNSFASYLNQAVRTGDGPSFTNVYTGGWFRNNGGAVGLYNESYANHWYATSSSQWNIGGTNNANCSIAFRPEGHQSTVRGYVYATTGNEIGFLNSAGDWAFKVDNSKNIFTYGTDLTVGNSTSSNIFMVDTDNTTRRIHCNSNQIGFLNSSNGWGAYCDNSGNWFANNLSGTNTGDQTNISGYAAYVSGNNTSTVGQLRFYGEGGNSSQSNTSYALYQEGGSWSNPFPDLAIGFHTGIKMGAYFGYNGIRIYNNSDFTTQIASFGDGDNNFRSYYNVIAYASDKRLKENVINIDNALQKVMKLNGVTFDWKKEVKDLGFTPTAWHECGVLAQEVEAVLPEAVEIAPFDYDWKAEDGSHSKSGQKYLTVKYEKIVPLLIEAMKEQQSQIEAQQKQIDQLMNLVKEMTK